MFKTLKGRILFGVIIIVTLLGIILNIAIVSIFNKNIENTIAKEINSIREITIDNLKNYMLIKNEENKEDILKDSWQIINKTSRAFNIYTALYDKKDNLEYSGSNLNINEVNNIIKESEHNKSLLKLNYKKDGLEGTYSYPIYINKKFYGTLVFQKQFNKLYLNNKSLITKIILIEIIVFVLLIELLYMLLYKTTKPLIKLSKAMDKVSQGDYKTSIEIKGKDEVATLANSFNLMKDKIQHEIETTRKEKNKVEALEKSSREFFNNATHEMKTPITAISGYAQLVKEEELDEEVKKRALDRMIIESKRMNTLVCNLLQISRGEFIKSKERKIFNLSELVNECINEMNIKCNQNNKNIEKHIENLSCYAVKEDIKKVIINLLDNGIKYSTSECINIKGYKGKDCLVLEFSNSCRGIPKDIEKRLFEPFIKNTYGNNNISSSGLGLYICKEIVNENLGYIDYKLDNFKITFKLELPTVVE